MKIFFGCYNKWAGLKVNDCSFLSEYWLATPFCKVEKCYSASVQVHVANPRRFEAETWRGLKFKTNLANLKRTWRQSRLHVLRVHDSLKNDILDSNSM